MMMRTAVPVQVCGVIILVLLIGGAYLYLDTRAARKNASRLEQTPTTKPLEVETSPIVADEVLQNMNLGELSDFFHGYIHGTQVLCSRRVRMGSLGDGGWDVCEDPLYKIDPSDCLVYSYGIARDYTFDAEMQKYGCEVHSYDPSLGSFDPSLGQKFHFHKVGIGASNSNKEGEWTFETIGTSREVNNHSPTERRLDIVKMDVEGHELGSLMTALDEGSLQDVSQLCFEIHLKSSVTSIGRAPVKEYLLSMLRLLRRLWLEGFRLYHTNRNVAPVNIYTNGADGKRRTHCYEVYMIRVHTHKN